MDDSLLAFPSFLFFVELKEEPAFEVIILVCTYNPPFLVDFLFSSSFFSFSTTFPMMPRTPAFMPVIMDAPTPFSALGAAFFLF